MDLLVSFQIGLPSIIRQDQCDTMLPRYLLDTDFDEDSIELPPSRPPTDSTPISYDITKAGLMSVFGKIVDQTLSIHPVSYEEIMKLDSRLRDAHSSVPPHLQVVPMELSFTDPAWLIMKRLNIELLYLKSLCVLHRRHMGMARFNPCYKYSKQTCIDSAMKLLGHQADIHRELQPNGQLYQDRWFISSFTTHDFLIAAMILSLDLSYTAKAASSGQSSGDVSTGVHDRRADMLQALDISYHIWNETKDQSTEAYRASEALAVMLGKVQAGCSAMSETATQDLSELNSATVDGLNLNGQIANSQGWLNNSMRDHVFDSRIRIDCL